MKLNFTSLVSISLFLTMNLLFSQGQDINVTGNGVDIINGGSNSPSLTNGTDMGDVVIGSMFQATYTIENTYSGGPPSKNKLTVSSISISGANASDFSVSGISLPTTINRNSSTTFKVAFSATILGSESGIISIFSNDPNENPYTFNIQGTGIIPTPEIEVTDSGSNTINSGGNFNFGTIPPGSSSNEIFTIENISSMSTLLNLTGSPIVDISGDSEFSVTTQPIGNSILGGNSQTFVVTYNPSISGSHTATISIDNDDPDGGEDPYIINLQGTANTVTYTPTTSGPDWTVTNITADNTLNYPNTIIYGPDNQLWITERVGKKVVKVDPVQGGSKSVMLDLSSIVYQTGGQDGLMGMAVHPDLYADVTTGTNNYVYLAYTYSTNGSDSGRSLRIARYNYIYNGGNGYLDGSTATTILEGFQASNDHNSGKLQIGPDMKLYYTAGDQGYNQFANACLEIQAQVLPSTGGQTSTSGDKSAYKGKILRIELDGSVPNDNPVFGGVQSHVYTYGHRNPQGLVFGSDGKLYSSEHGPKVDDELNLIIGGKNYGWPLVAGYYDNLGYAYCNWSLYPSSCGSFSDNGCPGTPVDEFTSGMPTNFQPPIGTYNSTTAIEPTGGFLTWPTVAPSSLAIYESGAIPGWNKSLLIPTLKRGTIYRAKLNATGDALESQTYEEFHSSNDRYRDVAVDPNGVTFYAITDNSGGTSGPSGTTSVPIDNPGVIVKIQYKCIVGGPCNDGNACTIDDVYDSDCNCLGIVADSDGDGVCNAEDVCEGFDDNLLGQPCDDLDPCTTNDIYVDCAICQGTYEDKDGDGLCVADDPDDNDGCNPYPNSPACNPCTITTEDFIPSTLTHSGSGSSSRTLNLSGTSEDVLSFTITGLDQVTGGKPSNRFIEEVVVKYSTDGIDNQDAGTFSAANGSSANVSISGPVVSITVMLQDGYDGNSSTTLSVNLLTVTYCDSSGGTGSRVAGSTKETAKYSDESIRIYPNPASTELIVEILGLNSTVNISMYAITGQLIKQVNMQDNRQIIDVNKLPEGLYLLRLTNANGEILKTDRIIIK